MKAATSQVMFSSETDLWETPQYLFDSLNSVFRFDLDVCATDENAKCGEYFKKQDNGLAQDWKGTCWMNPPYGDQIIKWVEKASKSAREGATVVALVPARTDTKWWHQYCAGEEVTFLKGRLKFGNCPDSAPFPSAIVVFRPRVEHALNTQLELIT